MDRRGFLSALGALGGGLLVTWQAQAATFAKLGLNPIDVSGLRTDSDRVFDLSISSADPSVTGVILWTHLRASEVRASESLYLQVASDAQFSQLVLQAEGRPDQIGPRNADRPSEARRLRNDLIRGVHRLGPPNARDGLHLGNGLKAFDAERHRAQLE